MNNFLFKVMTSKNIPVISTNHSRSRALQRCKLLMRQHERDNPHLFLLDIYKNTEPDLSVIFSPFMYNKLASIYGANTFVRRNEKYMLMCRYDIVKSCIVIKSIIYKRNNKFFI